MFIRVKSTPNSPRKSVQIVENKRNGDKISQKIVRYVGIAMDDIELEKLKDLAAEIVVKLEKDKLPQLDLFDEAAADADRMAAKRRGRPKHKSLIDVVPPDQVLLADINEESRIVEGVHEVAGSLYDHLGFNQLMPGKRAQEILKNIVLMRAFDPVSKLKSSDILLNQYEVDNKIDAIYRMMDKVHDSIPTIKRLVYEQTVTLFPNKINMVLFDVTTLYFESAITDDLRNFGYSKDQKYHCTQVVLALATNEDGLPIGYELFSGNKAETSTLIKCIADWRIELPIEKVTIIADRAMCSRDNLQKLAENNIGFIVALPLRRSLKRHEQETILADFKDAETAVSREYDWEGNRLVVSYCPKRAAKDKRDREKILEKLTVKLRKGKIKNLISNKGYLKYIKTTDKTNDAEINQVKVDADGCWDGLHAIITNNHDSTIPELLTAYHRLWVIEESFRLNKHNLAMRPIFHHKPERIKAHIAICYMAFTLIRHLQYRVRIAQSEISIDKLRDELRGVQASILIHKYTKDRYRLPGKFSNTARKIYRALGIERSEDVTVYLK